MIHWLVWFRQRTARANLLFSLLAVATAGLAACELWMMHTGTIEQFATALRWAHVPAWVVVLTLVGFVRLHLRAGRPWLAWTIVAVRTLSLLLNFLVGQNLNYLEVSRLRPVSFLGESVPVAEGTSNPWMLVGQLSLILAVVFVADAAVTVWRRGDRRSALVTGGSIIFFVVVGTVQAVLVLWQLVDCPITPSLFFMGLVAAMGYEVSRDTLRAAQLSEQLRESEARMTLAAEAAGFGVWMWNLTRNDVWGAERWLRLFGFAPGENLTFEKVIARIHPHDRERVERDVRQAVANGSDYAGEFRVILPDGTQRWIASRGRIGPNGNGKSVQMLGAALDITERKGADERFRLAVEASPSAIVMVNEQGRIVLVNALTEKIFGYPRGELAGQPVELLIPERFRGGHAGHRAGFFAEPHARMMGAGRELFARRKDGSEFAVEIGLNPIHAEDGRMVLCAIVDITERKRAETEVQELRRGLAHAGRVSLLGQLASALAHELSQPLGAILRNAEAAEIMLNEPSPTSKICAPLSPTFARTINGRET